MNMYLEEYKFFVENSQRKILDIEIRHKFYRSLYIEIHLMEEGIYKIFYNFGIRSNDLVRIMMNFINDYPNYKKNSFEKIIRDEFFIEVMRKNEPVIEKIISGDDSKNLKKLLESFPLKSITSKYNSINECTYITNIYTENEGSKYICWSNIPKEWEALENIIKILLSYIDNLQEGYFLK